jgi:DNA-binding response OmpR family regulator
MKKILVIDDNQDFLEMIQIVLSKKYSVRCVDHPEKAKQMILDFTPDLITVDYFLGASVATNLLHMIKDESRQKQIPIILFSGSNDIEKKAEELGAAGYIRKPSGINEILECIGNFFQGQ